MSDERFTVMKKFDGSYVICDNGKMLVADDCCDLLNRQDYAIEVKQKYIEKLSDFIQEQQATISALKEENEKLSEKNRRLIYHMNKEPKR